MSRDEQVAACALCGAAPTEGCRRPDWLSCKREDQAAAYFRYSVSYSKRDWPFRPWRWKHVTETRNMRIGAPRV